MRNALVTGASSGIGRELVRQLVRDRGMTVLATARRRDRLDELAAELAPGRVLVVDGDLTQAAFRARLWDEAMAAFPDGLDLLVNNAGAGDYAEFMDQDPAAIDRIFALNVFALFDLTQRASRHMKRKGAGQILQISSVLGFVGAPYSAAYVASKHAVNGLVKSLRYELRGTGVRVWAACPGRTESEFFRAALRTDDPRVRGPRGDSTERVVRAIVRALDRRCAFLLPSLAARMVVRASQGLPGPFEMFMLRWAPGYFRREIDRGRREAAGGGPPS